MRWLAGLAFSVLSVNMAQAQLADKTPLLEGEFEVFGLRGDCAGASPIGTIGTLRYQQIPSGTTVSFVEPSQVRSYFLPGARFDETFKEVSTMFLRYGFGPINHDVFLRFVSLSPATIGSSTPEVRMVGEVQGFTKPTCIARFRAYVVRWLP